MPRNTKSSQGKMPQATRSLRVRKPPILKTPPAKAAVALQSIVDNQNAMAPLSTQQLSSKVSEKLPLSEVTGNVPGHGVEPNIVGIRTDLPEILPPNGKIATRALSDSSITGHTQGSVCGYSTTVLKVEAFDILHKLLNVCCRSSSLDVLDAAKILQQITPEIMNTVVQMLGENIIKSEKNSSKRKDVIETCDTGDEEIKKIVTSGKGRQRKQAKKDKGQFDGGNQDVGQPRDAFSSSSSSPVSAAVHALMSFTGVSGEKTKKSSERHQSRGKPDGFTTEKDDYLPTSDLSGPVVSFVVEDTLVPSPVCTDGVIDVTDSVFKVETASGAGSVPQTSLSVMDSMASSEPGTITAQTWVPPFQYSVAKPTNTQDKQFSQDDLNLLPNIQSILNHVSPIANVPEMALNLQSGFSPLVSDNAAMTMKDHSQHSSSPVPGVSQKKSSLRTILPKPVATESNLRLGGITLPVVSQRNLEQNPSSAGSVPIATLIPTVSYAEQPSISANSGVPIKQLSLLSTSSLLFGPGGLGNVLTALSGHNVIFDQSILNAAGKMKDQQQLPTNVSSQISIPSFLDKSHFSPAHVAGNQMLDKFSTPLLNLQPSPVQATSVTYTESLKAPISTTCGDVTQRTQTEASPQKLEKGSSLEAASALLSMGSRNKDMKNNSQVVSGFNRQKHTFDIEEQSLGQRGDILFTSTGTFQIEDIEIDPKKNKIEKDNYACGKCGRVFTSILYLARHIKRVCPDMSHRKWKCDRCDKAFRHPFGLQQHIYTHTGERPYKCEQCSKAFYSANDLRRHKRTHSGERPYQCSHCNKAFSTTISLKTHTYIHTGERPHKCPVCGKTFATSSKLSRHVVTHSDQRPFSCDVCPKTFNRSGDLRRHYNHVHQQEHGLMECDECNKVFATSKCLVHHKATHNRDRPHVKVETEVSEPNLLDFKDELGS